MNETIVKLKLLKYNFLLQKFSDYQAMCSNHCDITYKQRDYFSLVKLETNSYIKWFLLVAKLKLSISYKKTGS